MFKRVAISAIASVGLALVQPAAIAQSTFQSTGLGEIDPWGIGSISRADGALPVTMWRGSEDKTLKQLMERINTQGLTPVGRKLLTRILLSPSQAPVGSEDDSLLGERMRLIWSLGELEAYIEIANRLQGSKSFMSGNTAAIELEFVRGNNASACSAVRANTGVSSYLFRARAVCFALEGDYSSADLALELGQEVDEMDPWIRSAINTLRSLPEDPEALAKVKLPAANLSYGLAIALSMEGNFPVDDTQLAIINPGFAREIYRRKDIDRKLRIDMADRAGLSGLLTPDQVRTAYRLDPVQLPPQAQAERMTLPGTTPVNPPETEAAEEEPEDLTNAPVNPLDEALQLAADRSAEKADIVRALRRVLLLSQSNLAQYQLTASILLPELNQLRDIEAIGDNSEFFALAALAAGNNGLANRLQRIPDIEGGPDENTYLQAWLNGVRVVNGSDRSTASSRTVSAILAEEAPSSAHPQTAKMMNVFLTFNGALSSEAVQFLSGAPGDTLSNGNSLTPKERLLMLANLKAGSQGEALLRVIRALGQSPHSLNSVDLNVILQLLASNGFETEARQIALEGLNYQRPGG